MSVQPHRHPLASAFADVSMARMAHQTGDYADCLLTLTGIAREVESYQPRDRDEAQSRKRVTRLLDRLIQRMKDR